MFFSLHFLCACLKYCIHCFLETEVNWNNTSWDCCILWVGSGLGSHRELNWMAFVVSCEVTYQPQTLPITLHWEMLSSQDSQVCLQDTISQNGPNIDWEREKWVIYNCRYNCWYLCTSTTCNFADCSFCTLLAYAATSFTRWNFSCTNTHRSCASYICIPKILARLIIVFVLSCI